MDRRWTVPAALAAAVWTFLFTAVPDTALLYPGGLRFVWQTAPPAAAEETPGTSPAPQASATPEALPSPAPEAAPTPEPEAEPTPAPSSAADGTTVRSFTDDSAARVRNFTGMDVDLDALEAAPLPQRLGAEGPQILIVHTHGTEAYLPVAGEEYAASDPYRTTDREHSVVRVGDVLCAALEAQGLNVVHDRELYDYPSYTGSYARSQAAVEAWLERYPGIGVVIDLHRDAVGADQVVYKTLARVAGDSAAQVMLVIGTGENGLDHPRWRDNLALALALQRAAEGEDPSLVRPVRLVKERYNQHLSPGAFILEVGANGNTLSEAERSAELFARAVGPVLASLIGK